MTDRSTFENIDLWFKELRSHSSPNVKVFLIGNKIDLEDERKVQTDEGERFVETYKIDKFLETSARTGFNAKNLFIEAAKLLYDDYTTNYKDSDSENMSETSLKQSETNEKMDDVNSRGSSVLRNSESKSGGCC